jgi:RHS repeat-associated protein
VVGGFDPADTTLSTLADSTAYDPFGQRIASSGEESNVGFQGDWTDPDTDQVNMGARWYDPGSGAFTSRDSVTYASGKSILANRYSYAAGDPLGNTDPDGHWPSCSWCRKALNKVGNVVSSGYNALRTGASIANDFAGRQLGRLWRYSVSGFRFLASKFVSGLRALGSGISFLYNKARDGLKQLGKQFLAGTRWLGRQFLAGTRALGKQFSEAASWSRAKVEQAKRAVIAAKQHVTRVAKAAVALAVKHNPLPVLRAALKPVLSGIKQVVSAAAHLPAAVVSTVRDVVHDAGQTVQALYQKAVTATGAVVQTLSKATEAVSEFVQTHKATIAGIAAGLVVGVGCGVAIGWTGVGAVACGALAGAVGSVVHDLVEGGHSWEEMGKNALFSGVIGAVTGGLGSVAGAAIGAGIRAVGGGARSAVQAAVSAGRGEISNIASGRVGGLLGRPRGCNSFVGQTAVLMANGTTKAIENVRVGDVVVATDPTTGKTEHKRVTGVIVGKGEKKLVEITVDVDGKDGNETGKLTATDGHPFWVPSLNEWVTAAELKAGALLRTSAGTYVQVTAVRQWTAQEQRAFNFTVDGIHTYYAVAGAAAVLVHNCGGASGAPREANGQPATLTFRGDSRGPGEISETGFKAAGDDMDLLAHANYDNPATSGYVATSLLPEMARRFGPNVYAIRAHGGVDVNLNLGARSPYPEEAEIAIPHGVDPGCIIGCTLPDGRWVPMAGYGK